MKTLPPRFALACFLLMAALASSSLAGAAAMPARTVADTSAAPAGSAGAWIESVTASAVPQSTSEALFENLRWRNIGPANMMGRIASIDALDTDHRVVLVASASGGVFPRPLRAGK